MSFRLFKGFAVLLVCVLGGFAVSAQTNGHSQALTRCAVRPMPLVPSPGALASDGVRVYAGLVNGTITAMDAGQLEVVWRADLGGEVASEIIIVNGGIAVVTNQIGESTAPSENSILRMLSKEAGITNWSLKLPYSERYHLGKMNGGVVAIGQDGSIALADHATGRIAWQAGPFGAVTAKPSFSVESIVLGTSDKNLLVISAKDGSVITKQTADFVPVSVSFLKNEGIAAGDARGNVILFEQKGAGLVWKFKSGAAVSSATEIDDGILVTSLDNFVYLLSDYNGDVIWKRRLTGRVTNSGLAIDGFLVVLMYGENSAFVIDLETGKVTDMLPALEKEIVSRVPVYVKDRSFAFATTTSVETYSLGQCLRK